MAVALGALLFGSGSSTATTSVELDLRQCSRMSGVIFAGTVGRISTRHGSERGEIFTDVTFRNLRFARGDSGQKRLTLTLLGGTLGGITQNIVGQPGFRLGSRYVVFVLPEVDSESHRSMPIVGLEQGVFPVEYDSASGGSVVRNWDDRPIQRVEDGRVVPVAHTAEPAPPGTFQISDEYSPTYSREQIATIRESLEVKRARLQKDRRGGRGPKIEVPPPAAATPALRPGPRNDTGERLTEEKFLAIVSELASGR